ncbi:Putative zinc-finger [Fontimonas thermophila]|uniref:Putative zinc-finger n=1 Tax=Fontimonas thermophila TaxID=1076937 RepID=A0A1I2KG68_9GAMM|nr:zf-HC2 domain-containing protein [Fontimonas thermophila]SFF65954.1 Putative zinc-finger [Fontimonas thermophila]
MLNCRDATRLMSEAQDRPLRWGETISLKMHVMMCSGCRHFGDQMHVLRRIVRAYADGADESATTSQRSDQDAAR